MIIMNDWIASLERMTLRGFGSQEVSAWGC
jgi:hypothetical protein